MSTKQRLPSGFSQTDGSLFASSLPSEQPSKKRNADVKHQRKRFVSYKEIKPLMADLKRVYAAVDEQAALNELDRFEELWGKKYPKIGRSWREN